MVISRNTSSFEVFYPKGSSSCIVCWCLSCRKVLCVCVCVYIYIYIYIYIRNMYMDDLWFYINCIHSLVYVSDCLSYLRYECEGSMAVSSTQNLQPCLLWCYIPDCFLVQLLLFINLLYISNMFSFTSFILLFPFCIY